MSGSEAFRIPETMAADVLKVSGVRSAVAIGQNSVDAPDNNTGKRLVDGVRLDEYAAISGLRLVEGRPFEDGKDEAVIDTAWQRQKKLSVGDTIPLYERQFTIVGTYEPAGGVQGSRYPLSTMPGTVGEEGKASSILVAVDPGQSADEVGQRLQEAFPDNHIILTRDLENS